MKRFLLLIPYLILGVSACSTNNKFTLSYGTYKDDNAIEINYADLGTIINNKESFLLTVHPLDESCTCWRDFKRVQKEYVETYRTIIYQINISEFNNNSTYGIKVVNDAPTFTLFKKGKLYKEYQYNSNVSLFKYTDKLHEEVSKYTYIPSLYKVDLDYLKDVINNKKEKTTLIHFTRESCPDCSYCLPNALIPYIETKHQLANKIYLLDLDEYKDISDEVKATFQLAEATNSAFGYKTGVVPTTQVYKQGVLKDASVYVNDSIAKKDNGEYYIKETYYTTARSKNLSYLDNIKTPVLENLVLTVKDITKYEYEGGEYLFWNYESASKYHTPLLYAFLDMYTK